MRINITLPDDWHAKAVSRAQERGLSFSEYLRELIERDLPKATKRQLSAPRGPGRPAITSDSSGEK